MLIDDNQSSKYASQPKPTSTSAETNLGIESEKFVVLPHHPLYGRVVKVVERRVRRTYVDCTIEEPTQPTFRYHIHESWLSSTPPLCLPKAPMPNETICVNLSALDKMVQNLLTTSYFRRISHDEQAYHPVSVSDPATRSAPADLEPTSADQPHSAPTSALLPGTPTGRRNLP
jgi:hypothetical protein